MPAWLADPAIRWVLPLPVLLALAPLVWRFFRSTWVQLEEEALAHRQAMAAAGKVDLRPAVAMAAGTFIILVLEVFGRSAVFSAYFLPRLQAAAAGHPPTAEALATYGDLVAKSWWAWTRVVGYLSPLLFWRLVFPEDRVLDMGLRVRGLREHAWLYALFVVVIVPLLWVAGGQADFAEQYPIFAQAGRSWLDFLVWEAGYLAQFFALEVFFRGFWLRACRGLGVGAIFSMMVPYTMIHLGKPYFEACGAIVAGVVLGSLAARTRSIWAGFLVHATIALLMDVRNLGLEQQLPERLTAHGSGGWRFPYWDVAIWGSWAAALVVLSWHVWSRRRVRRG